MIVFDGVKILLKLLNKNNRDEFIKIFGKYVNLVNTIIDVNNITLMRNLRFNFGNIFKKKIHQHALIN